MNISTETEPRWFAAIPEERRGIWTEKDGERALSENTLPGFPIRMVLKNGTILDGEKGEERDNFDGGHDVAIRLPGRKTQKWVPEEDIAVIWADKGPDLRDVMAAFVERMREAIHDTERH